MSLLLFSASPKRVYIGGLGASCLAGAVFWLSREQSRNCTQTLSRSVSRAFFGTFVLNFVPTIGFTFRLPTHWQVVVWDTSKDEPLIGMTKIDDLFHREPVTSVGASLPRFVIAAKVRVVDGSWFGPRVRSGVLTINLRPSRLGSGGLLNLTGRVGSGRVGSSQEVFKYHG